MNEMSFFNKDILRFEIYLIKIGFEVMYIFCFGNDEENGFFVIKFLFVVIFDWYKFGIGADLFCIIKVIFY